MAKVTILVFALLVGRAVADTTQSTVDCSAGTLEVNKYYDANANGVLDVGEVPVPWQFQITSPLGTRIYVTSPWSSTVPAGLYRVCQMAPTEYKWVTTTTDTCRNVTVAPGPSASAAGLCACTGNAAAKKANHWAAVAGLVMVTPSDLSVLSAMPLKNAAGVDVDFTNTTHLKNYLGAAFPGSGNAPYYLSFHLAASKLNELHLVDPTRRLKASTAVATLVGSRFPTLAAVNTLGEFLLSSAADPALMVAVGNFISISNQNEGWIQLSPCALTFSTAPPDDLVGFSIAPGCLTTGFVGTTGNDCVTPQLSLHKIYDTNANGVPEPGEPDIEGWLFQVTNLGTMDSMYAATPALLDLPYGSYRVCDVVPAETKWARTGANVGCRNVTLSSPTATEVLATCVCAGPASAKKPNHWATNPLKMMVIAGDLLALRNLPLEDNAGGAFDPTTANQLALFLTPASSVILSNRYHMSMQLAASALNVAKGLVPATKRYRSKTELVTAVGGAFPTIAELNALAVSLLTAPGPSPYELPVAMQLKDLNGNQGWVQDAPCNFTLPAVATPPSGPGLTVTLPPHCASGGTTGSCPYGIINLTKVYDANANGMADAGEQWIEDWEFILTNLATGGQRIILSPQVLYLALGSYMICDVAPTSYNWASTGPALCRNVTLTGPTPVYLEADSICFGESTQKSNNYWAGAAGQSRINASDLESLRDLNLVDADGNAFDPTLASDLVDFIQAQNSTNVPYYLSVQLATMMLNLWHFVSPQQIIKANAGVAVLLTSFPYVSQLTALADTLLLTPGSGLGQQNSVAANLKSLSQGEGWAQDEPCSYSFLPSGPFSSDAGTLPPVCQMTTGVPVGTTGQCPYGVIQLAKVFDHNANGVSDSGEPWIVDWEFTLTNVETGGVRYFKSPNTLYLPLGTFTVCDVIPTSYNWVSTGPALCRNVTLTGTTPVYLEAASLCFGESTQKSNNYWAGAAGQSRINASDLESLRDLNLVDADGNTFDPTLASDLVDFIQAQNSTNVPYYLSVQLATMMLNLYHFVSPSQIIKANAGVDAVLGSFPTVFDLSMSANTYLLVPGDNVAQQVALAANMKTLSQGEGWAQSAPCTFAFAAHGAPSNSAGTSLPAYCGVSSGAELNEAEGPSRGPSVAEVLAGPTGSILFTVVGCVVGAAVVAVVAVVVIRRRRLAAISPSASPDPEVAHVPAEDEFEVFTEK